MVHDHPLCLDCCQAGLERLHGGSGTARFMRALALGLASALSGAACMYAFIALTGHQAGLVSIFVGFLVGKSVMKGTGGAGGALKYQVMAVLLTYSAVAWSQVPFVVQHLMQGVDPNAPAPPPQGPFHVSLILTLGLALIFAISYVWPFLGLPHSIMGLVIIFFGLRAAWRLTRKVDVVFHGPFSTEATAAEPAEGEPWPSPA